MEPWLQALIVAATSVLASSGFWAFLQRRSSSKDATTRLLMGLAHDKIAQVGMSYIERGWVSRDEYEDFCKYLVGPYTELGGNGIAKRIMEDVTALPLRQYESYSQVVRVEPRTDKETSRNAPHE